MASHVSFEFMFVFYAARGVALRAVFFMLMLVCDYLCFGHRIGNKQQLGRGAAAADLSSKCQIKPIVTRIKVIKWVQF